MLVVYTWFRGRAQWAAADLTAETFAQAWLSHRRFRDDRGGSALPWLYGVARNVLRESARRDRVESRARERLGLPPAPGSRRGCRFATPSRACRSTSGGPRLLATR